MLVKCPNCFAQYRVNISRVSKSLVQVRCPSCQKTVMLNVKKLQESQPRQPASGLQGQQNLAARDVLSDTTIKRFGDLLTVTVDGKEQKPHVLIADEPRAFRDFLGKSLEEIGCEVLIVDDGRTAEEAILSAKKPQIAFLNVVLNNVQGYILCERIKMNPALADIKVVLIGAIFRIDRFRRDPTNLYGADDYIEEIIVKQDLHSRVRRLLGYDELGEALSADEPDLDEMENSARRLARIILSDIVIYNHDRLDPLIQADRFYDELGKEIRDGDEYFQEKIATDRPEIQEIYHQTIDEYVRRRKRELAEREKV